MKIEGILLYQCHDIFFFCISSDYMQSPYTNYVWSSDGWCLHSIYLQRCSLQRVRITRLVHQYNLHSQPATLSTVGSMLNCTFALVYSWGKASEVESGWDRAVSSFCKEDGEWLWKEGGKEDQPDIDNSQVNIRKDLTLSLKWLGWGMEAPVLITELLSYFMCWPWLKK